MVSRDGHEAKAVEIAIEQLVELAGGPGVVSDRNGSDPGQPDESVTFWVRAILFDDGVHQTDALRYVEQAVDSLRTKGASYSLHGIHDLIRRDASDLV